MNDPLLVRVLDRLADGDEKRESVPGSQVDCVTVLGDRHALDQLHHEIRPASVGGAGVEDPRDRRVVHERQHLALGLEPRYNLLRVHARLDDLERDPAGPAFPARQDRRSPIPPSPIFSRSL